MAFEIMGALGGYVIYIYICKKSYTTLKPYTVSLSKLGGERLGPRSREGRHVKPVLI